MILCYTTTVIIRNAKKKDLCLLFCVCYIVIEKKEWNMDLK